MTGSVQLILSTAFLVLIYIHIYFLLRGKKKLRSDFLEKENCESIK